MIEVDIAAQQSVTTIIAILIWATIRDGGQSREKPNKPKR
jgi:hypothetical protein